jgi:hypothetical protein
MQQSDKPEYRVLVCGGRDYGKTWDDARSQVVIDSNAVRNIYNTLSTVRSQRVPKDHTLVIVHGAARGTDSIANDWALEHGVKIMSFPAQWGSGDKSAGTERNILMLEESEPNLVVAFPGGRGTAHMVGLARKTKTPLIVVTDEE